MSTTDAPRTRPAVAGHLRWPLLLVVPFAVVATPAEPFSRDAEVSTALACALVFGYALWFGRHRRSAPAPPEARTPPVRAIGLAAWALLLGGFAVHQLAIFGWTDDRSVYPTLSALLNIALEPWPVRVFGFASWVWFGLWLVHRVPGGPDGQVEPPRYRPPWSGR